MRSLNSLSCKKNVLVFVDQPSGLKQSYNPRERVKYAKLDNWLEALTFHHKRVYSSAGDDMNYCDQASKQRNDLMLGVYGGLDDVSYRNHNYVPMRLLTRLGGNGPVVEATRNSNGRLHTASG
jgi:hypothetical protein